MSLSYQGISNPKVTAGPNFKNHFQRYRKLLENITGKKYSKLKANGPEFLNDISELINNGTFKYVGQSTGIQNRPVWNIYKGEGLVVATKTDGEWVTLLEDSDTGLAKTIDTFMINK
ncbi:hypothetical protein [uncultured Clostridium sp.]|uniref:hypothetical protein n=1 Tax=uncultured Clostridium sp. TaxID=59620 RepID=UPI0028EA6B81|nr:hypothetical protein [uncultured Clostridium sp.]